MAGSFKFHFCCKNIHQLSGVFCSHLMAPQFKHALNVPQIRSRFLILKIILLWNNFSGDRNDSSKWYFKKVLITHMHDSTCLIINFVLFNGEMAKLQSQNCPQPLQTSCDFLLNDKVQNKQPFPE